MTWQISGGPTGLFTYLSKSEELRKEIGLTKEEFDFYEKISQDRLRRLDFDLTEEEEMELMKIRLGLKEGAKIW